MSNPSAPKGDDESGDKTRQTDKQPDNSTLSLSDIVAQEKMQQAAASGQHAEAQQQNVAAVPEFRPSTSPQFTYQFGQSPAFQMRKSEFLHEKEQKVTEIKPLVDQFLKETHREDHTLSPAQLHELTKTRESLSRFTDPNDAISKALQLAKLYQHARFLEEAKAATNLSLGIDPENHLGKEMFKELERVHPVDVATSPRPRAASSLSKSRLRACINSMSQGRVIVVGDHLIDELLEGKPERISREAPVLILEHVDTELIPGGASNTANNIAALGGNCHAIGVCGRDDYSSKLAGLFDKAGITHSMVHDPSRPTTVKTRILSRSHSFQQQLLRLDRISHEPVSALIESMLVDRVKQAAGGGYQALVLSDYRGGAITDGVIRACRSAAEAHNLMLVVDAQDRPERFQNVTLMTPNQPDAEKMIGYALDSREALENGGKDLLLLTGAKAILITRGAQGMVLFEEGRPMIELPVFNKSEVFDVTGAGDTVVAAMTLALVSGASFLEAMALGNLAAGIVVKKQGTAVTSQKEMLDNLERIDLDE